MLYAKNPKHLRYLFKEYKSMRSFFIQKGLEAEVLNFEPKMNLIWTHFQYPQLPRTNNIIEGIIDKLKHKITDCHGFTYPQDSLELHKDDHHELSLSQVYLQPY